MKGYVDKDTCISCQLCPAICPDIFYMDDDGIAAGKDIEIPEDLIEEARDAEDQCPVAAITVK